MRSKSHDGARPLCRGRWATPVRDMLPIYTASGRSREREAACEVQEESADAAIHPDDRARTARKPRGPCRGPCDDEVPQRPVHVEERAKEEKGERLARGVRVDELRQEGEKEKRYLRIQDVGEESLPKN